jgi:hypothetical protein
MRLFCISLALLDAPSKEEREKEMEAIELIR